MRRISPTLAGLIAAVCMTAKVCAAEEAADSADIAYYALKPSFVSNLTGGPKYIRCDIQLMTENAADIPKIELHTPALRHGILMLIGGKDGAQLKTRDGKEEPAPGRTGSGSCAIAGADWQEHRQGPLLHGVLREVTSNRSRRASPNRLAASTTRNSRNTGGQYEMGRDQQVTHAIADHPTPGCIRRLNPEAEETTGRPRRPRHPPVRNSPPPTPGPSPMAAGALS